MNNCKNLKLKLTKELYCKYLKSDIKISDCSSCKYKEYKITESHKIKTKSKKLAKLERNRFSLFSDNKDKCFLCPNITDLTWHEIYSGRNRRNSMKYGLCLRLCFNCHEKYQEDKSFNEKWHKQGQIAFNNHYPNLNFIEIFKKNYLGGDDKRKLL